MIAPTLPKLKPETALPKPFEGVDWNLNPRCQLMKQWVFLWWRGRQRRCIKIATHSVRLKCGCGTPSYIFCAEHTALIQRLPRMKGAISKHVPCRSRFTITSVTPL